MSISNIGNKVAAYRQVNGLTIAQMAEKTGISTALISQIERDLANPTYSVLEILANTLGVSLPELVSEEVDEESLVLRVSERENIYYSNDKNIYYNLLTPEPMKSNVRFSLVHIEPNSVTSNGEFYQHKDDEIVYILTGSVVAIYEHANIILNCGDTLRVPANKKHKYSNHTNEVTELLTIKTIRHF